MNIADVKRHAFAMPLTSPAFPPRRNSGAEGHARPELPAEDHSARRRQRAHLRAGALLSRRRYGQGRVVGPGRALAPVAQLPVLEVLSGTHILIDMTLGMGAVIHDYLA